MLLSRTRNNLAAAGRRAGKSWVGGYKLVPEAFRAYAELDDLSEQRLRREYWIVGPEYSDAEKEFRVVWDALKRLGFTFDRPGSYNNPESGEMVISMFNRKFIISAKSAKYPGTLVGEGLSGVVFSEAAKLKWSIYNKYIRPTLADFGGWTFMGSTPEGRNWFYDFYTLGQNEDRQDWSSWRSPAWANPHVYPGGCDEGLLRRLFEARERHDLDAFLASVGRVQEEMGLVPVGIDPEIFSLFLDQSSEMFNQEIAALFTEYVGVVFKDFDEDLHVLKRNVELRPDWKTYGTSDYGFTNPFVWLLVQVDPFGERAHIVDEFYERGLTTGEAVDGIRARRLASNSGPNRMLAFFPDPAEPDRTREVSQRLQIPAGRGTGGPIQDRLEWIRRFLKTGPAHLPLDHPERGPMLTINPRCKNTIREMGAYRYKETAEQADEKNRPAPEAPLKKDDHTPEALGRLFSGLFGTPWAHGKGGVQVSKVSVGR